LDNLWLCLQHLKPVVAQISSLWYLMTSILLSSKISRHIAHSFSDEQFRSMTARLRDEFFTLYSLLTERIEINDGWTGILFFSILQPIFPMAPG